MQANNSQNQQGTNQNGKPSLSWSQPTAPKVVPPPAPKKTDTSSKSSTSTFVSVFIGGLIVGVLLGWGITDLRQGGSSMAMTSSTASSDTSATMEMATSSSSSDSSMALTGSMVGETSFAVATQSAGFSVAVSGVNVAQPTWVVIYDDNKGVPGNALGAGLFYPTSMGGSTSGSVPLLRATLSGTNYIAGESLDNDTRQFSLKDKEVLDGSGNPIWVTFQTN